MSDRPRRHTSAPKKFSIEEGRLHGRPRSLCELLSLLGYALPDSPERDQQQRVLRYLNVEDLNSPLQDLTVYVLWPEDDLWYEALIQKVSLVDMNFNHIIFQSSRHDNNAKLFYTDTTEEEIVDLEELIMDRHIAFCKNHRNRHSCEAVVHMKVEMRPVGVELKEDELVADGRIHVAPSPSASEAIATDEGSSVPEEGSPTQHQEKKLPIIKRPKTIPQMEVARPFGLEAIELQTSSSGLFAPGLNLNGNTKTLKTSSSLKRQSSTGSRDYLPPMNIDVMTKLREKTIEQLRAVLKLGSAEPSPDIDQQPSDDTVPQTEIEGDDPVDILAKSIEVEILKLCGGENSEYKNKFRSLYFNLKDVRNPELRRSVIKGDVSPEQLVSMSPEELAPRELHRWRQKKKEELLQATVLDQDAAAQFSTAAAMKQLETIREQRRAAERVDAPSRPLSIQVAMHPATNIASLETTQPTVEETHELSESEHEEVHEQHEAVIEGTSSASYARSAHDAMSGPSDAIDMEEIPDWAMEVVEAPAPVPAPVLYSPKAEERNNSVFGPVPIQSSPDLTALLMRGGEQTIGRPVWNGEISCMGQVSFKAQCLAIAGRCDLSLILPTPRIIVQGRMQLKKVEDFLERLRTSKSRSVTIGILRPPPDATDEDIAAIQENVHYYLSRDRTASMSLEEGLEGYLIAKCGLTGRLLLAAQMVMENSQIIPADIDVNEFLLVVVHKKDWMPASVALVEPQIVHEADVSDPRIRAGIKPVVQRELLESTPVLPTGLTLESISNLAAMLGVQKSASIETSPPPPGLPPHQMTVPSGNPRPMQSQTTVSPERPKFLMFDPLANKAIPMDPTTVQYDPNSNRVMIVGPLPDGYAISRLTTFETQTNIESVVPTPQPPTMTTVTHGASLTSNFPQGITSIDVADTDETTTFRSAPMPITSGLHLSRPMVQPVIPGTGGHGHVSFHQGLPVTQGIPTPSFPQDG